MALGPTDRIEDSVGAPSLPIPKSPPVLKFMITEEGGRAPVRHHVGDTGYDLFVAETVHILPGSQAQVPHHIAIQPPPRIWGLLLGRSSAFTRRGLYIMPGVIDTGYRGEIFTSVYNLSQMHITLEPGDRISQLILMPLMVYDVEPVGKLAESTRGDGGYGSTGQ